MQHLTIWCFINLMIVSYTSLYSTQKVEDSLQKVEGPHVFINRIRSYGIETFVATATNSDQKTNSNQKIVLCASNMSNSLKFNFFAHQEMHDVACPEKTIYVCNDPSLNTFEKRVAKFLVESTVKYALNITDFSESLTVPCELDTTGGSSLMKSVEKGKDDNFFSAFVRTLNIPVAIWVRDYCSSSTDGIYVHFYDKDNKLVLINSLSEKEKLSVSQFLPQLISDVLRYKLLFQEDLVY